MATLLGYRCVDCSFEWEQNEPSCPSCGGTKVGRRFGQVLAAQVQMKASLTALADNRHGDVEVVQYRSPNGGRADSTLSPSELTLSIGAPLHTGRSGEPAVADRVASVLRSEGHTLEVQPHRDDRGEDHALLVDGERITVQVVTLPANTEFLREASHGSASTSVSHETAAGWVADCVRKKAVQYSAKQKSQMLLAVDAHMVGALVSENIISALADKYGDTCARFGFAAIWLIGPSDSRCTRLGSSRL